MLQRLVMLLGQFTNETFPTKPGKVTGLNRLDIAVRLYVSTNHLLSDWPTHFNELLAKRLRLVRTATNTARLPDAFGSLYRVLYEHLVGDEHQFLRDAFESFLRDHWWGVLCRRNKRLQERTVGRHPQVSLCQARAQTGIAGSRVKRLLRAEAVSADVIDTRAGRQLTLLDERDLPQLSVLSQSALTLQEAARRLALPERLVRLMVDARLVTQVAGRLPNGRGAWMISDHLPRPPAASVGAPSRVLRFVLRYWCRSNEERVGLLDALLRGTLQDALGTSEGVYRLGQADVSVAAVQRWLECRRANQAGAAMTVRDAARSLRVKEEVAYELVRRKLIPTWRPPGFREQLIDPAEVDRFASAYVSLAALARVAATSPRALLLKLAVAPAIGPSIDGCRQYFFRRVDVATAGITVSEGR
jgi:excisionase family DNA binding protein